MTFLKGFVANLNLRASVSLMVPFLMPTAPAQPAATPGPTPAPENRRPPRKATRNKGHSATAESYGLFRRFPAGRISTLRKTAKLYRMRGEAPEVKPEERARHHHPRHERQP